MLVSLTKKRGEDLDRRRLAAEGAPTVTLKKGGALTLMNTADGTRYVLRLVSIVLG